LDIIITMLDSTVLRNLLRLALLGVLIALLGLAPRPHHISQELLLARRAMNLGSPRSASNHLEQAAQHMPQRAELWELAGRQAFLAGDAQTAIHDLTQAPQERLSLQGRLDLGDAYLQNGDLDAAIQVWQSAASAGSTSPDLYQRLWTAHLTAGDYPNAIERLRVLVTLQPDQARLRYQLGLLLATQDPEAALSYLVQAAELDPGFQPAVSSLRRTIRSARLAEDRAYTLLAAGRGLASLGEWKLAAEAFHQAVENRQDYAEAWAYLGEARQHVEPGQNDAGYAELQQALKLDPHSLSALSFLSLYWQRHERYDLALESLQRAIDLDAENPVLYAELGNLTAIQGDLVSALDCYQRAIALAPNDSAFRRHLVNFSLKYEYQLHPVGLPAARQAVILDAGDPANLDAMAQVLIKLDDQVNAARFLQRALQADPEFAPAHLHLGLVFLFQGQEGRAYEQFNQARSLSGGTVTADQAERLLRSYFP
jgi:tetratricopeptide (TPR) repeat protein